MRLLVCILFAIALPIHLSVISAYVPTWESLDSRPNPEWYDDAKLGIFAHWGLYSVPSYGPSVWFWGHWLMGYKEPKEFMERNYKPGFHYQDFADQFTADLFNASEFARIVQESGAKYFVFTSKHHEGYCMWPSPTAWNWNSVDTGPHIDIVGELEKAFRQDAPDVHFGLYLSLLDWAHPYYVEDKENNFRTRKYPQIAIDQFKELVMKYKPDVMWGDGNWEASSDYWGTKEALAWLFNESPVNSTVVINDRWGNETQCHHGGTFTCHDGFSPGTLQNHKWEDCMMIDSGSWGYSRSAKLQDFYTTKSLIVLLMQTVSTGGNLLMDVGPTDDGRILPIFEERLSEMGQWLKANGESVYGTRPWTCQNDTATPGIWYTSKSSSVYATVTSWPETGVLELGCPNATTSTTVTLLGYGRVPFQATGAHGLMVHLRTVNWVKLPSTLVWVLKIDNLNGD